MKLLTHNLLCSNVRGLRPGGGFPLRIQASDVCVRPVPFNAAFVARLVPRLRWGALLEAAESLGHPSNLPPEPTPDYEGDEAFLRRVHHVLLEVEVLEGFLQCPDSGRQFPISRGIPNMLLREEEA
ncbi:multifunctional methyltransferase subunit TRM112-like protein [Neopsephotus bourkii]|uniref:multifunctional methyltransferase subunit TRM112-like protein n=1 Tax=Neopsephotus bourkii TaxID=309878 RepID=UPI002AA556E2|nr:multifunctional methyltransferase subunit TRM112-like protein [Neopsephotus bourkii]XP_061225444.1 multifunctional methyltransferase subunit TRM112-like protein [Neopsephotus bourkii]